MNTFGNIVLAAAAGNSGIGAIIGYPLGWIMWALYKVVNNYGIALIIFTVIMKLLLYPMSVKQQKSNARMAVMNPKISELQKKYANDKQKLNEEMTALYQKEKYNPLSGCLPLVLQFVVLFGLIDVIYNPLTHILRCSKEVIAQAREITAGIVGAQNAALVQQLQVISAVKENASAFSALGTDFIEKVNTVNLGFLGLNLGDMPSWSWPIILVPLLSGITSLIFSLYSTFTQKQTNPNGDQGNGMMKGMMFIMPLFSFFFAMKVPAGVGLYWIASNVLSLVQTLYLNKKYNPKEMVEKMKAEEEEQKRLKKESRAEMQEKKEKGEKVEKELEEKALTPKEAARKKLAEARRRDAEKYGEEYVEPSEDDVK